MIKLLGITKDKIIYEQTDHNQPPKIRFNKISRDTYGNIDLEQFFEFTKGFPIGSGQVYGKYLYYLSDGGLYRADPNTEQRAFQLNAKNRRVRTVRTRRFDFKA